MYALISDLNNLTGVGGEWWGEGFEMQSLVNKDFTFEEQQTKLGQAGVAPHFLDG